MVAFIAAGVCAPAQAQSDLLSLSIGYYDINDNEDAVDFRAEYRWDDPLVWVIKPWAGVEASSDAAFYALGGLLADIKVGSGFLITPSFGAGLYADGGGKELGSAVEFRSQLEMGWEFEGGARVGVAGGHISNGGLGDKNPGTEFLNLYYHIPVQELF